MFYLGKDVKMMRRNITQNQSFEIFLEKMNYSLIDVLVKNHFYLICMTLPFIQYFLTFDHLLNEHQAVYPRKLNCTCIMLSSNQKPCSIKKVESLTLIDSNSSPF